MTDTTPTPVDLDQIRAAAAYATGSRPDDTGTERSARAAASHHLVTTAVPAMVAEIEQLRAALALASGGDTARDTVRRLLTKASDHAKRADRYRTAWRNARGRARRARAEIDMWKRQLTLAEESRDRAVRDLYDADALTDHLCDANRELGRETRIARDNVARLDAENGRLLLAGADHTAYRVSEHAREQEIARLYGENAELSTRVDELETAHGRVRELHQVTSGTGWGPDEDPTPGAYGRIARACTTCGSPDQAVRHPCPTIRALDAVPARTQEPQQ